MHYTLEALEAQGRQSRSNTLPNYRSTVHVPSRNYTVSKAFIVAFLIVRSQFQSHRDDLDHCCNQTRDFACSDNHKVHVRARHRKA